MSFVSNPGSVVRKSGGLFFAALLIIASCSSDDDAADSTTSVTAEGSTSSVELPTEPMSEETASLLDELAMTALDEHGGELPGMWIGVWDSEQGVHVAAYGNGEDGGATAAPDDKGRIGSITKTFTSTAILELVADGSLSLDDTIADVLPDLAEDTPEIADVTIEQLLSMRSGLPEYEVRVVGDVIADPTAVADPREIIVSTVSEQGVTDPPTGEYSTANYLILGEVLEAVTGDPVEDVINDLVQRAGLENTALQPPDEVDMPAPASHGYVNTPAAGQLQQEGVDTEPLGDVTDYNPSWGGSGGAMYSTVEDLGKWAALGFGNALLPDDLAEQRLDSGPIDVGDYGLGLLTFDGGWYGHLGEILGWESIALYNPDTGSVFVGIVNESGSLDATSGPALSAFPDLSSAFGG